MIVWMGKLFSYLWCHIDTISRWSKKISRALYMYMFFLFFFFIQYLSMGIQFRRASLNGALTTCTLFIVRLHKKKCFRNISMAHCEHQWIRCQFEKIVYPIWYSTSAFFLLRKHTLLLLLM